MLVDGLRPKRCSNRDNATLMMPLLLSHFRLPFLRLQLLLKLMILKGGIFFLLSLKNQSCQLFITESSVRSHLFVPFLLFSSSQYVSRYFIHFTYIPFFISLRLSNLTVFSSSQFRFIFFLSTLNPP